MKTIKLSGVPAKAIEPDEKAVAYLLIALRMNAKGRKTAMTQPAFDNLFHLGYVEGSSGACSPTSRAYSWQAGKAEVKKKSKLKEVPEGSQWTL